MSITRTTILLNNNMTFQNRLIELSDLLVVKRHLLTLWLQKIMTSLKPRDNDRICSCVFIVISIISIVICCSTTFITFSFIWLHEETVAFLMRPSTSLYCYYDHRLCHFNTNINNCRGGVSLLTMRRRIIILPSCLW